MDYQKSFKKLTLFYLSNTVPFNRQSYQKQKGPGTSDQSLFRLQNKFTKISLLAIYYLNKFDGVIQSVFQKLHLHFTPSPLSFVLKNLESV